MFSTVLGIGKYVSKNKSNLKNKNLNNKTASQRLLYILHTLLRYALYIHSN